MAEGKLFLCDCNDRQFCRIDSKQGFPPPHGVTCRREWRRTLKKEKADD